MTMTAFQLKYSNIFKKHYVWDYYGTICKKTKTILEIEKEGFCGFYVHLLVFIAPVTSKTISVIDDIYLYTQDLLGGRKCRKIKIKQKQQK